MAAEDDRPLMDAAFKGRSASICAFGFPPGGAERLTAACAAATANASTPPPHRHVVGAAAEDNKRRRPAVRSQSARAGGGGGGGGGRSIRKKTLVAAAAGVHHEHHLSDSRTSVRSGHSDPRLHESTTGQDGGTTFKRKPSSRKVNSNHRKSGAFLDVPPGDNKKPAEPEDPENSYRLRSFSFTSKGIVNRGDSFRRRRSRSNSLAREDDAAKECTPPIPYNNNNNNNNNSNNNNNNHQQQQRHAPLNGCDDIAFHTVSLLGSRGVGKTALISQFMTSEYINAYEKQRDNYCESSVQSVCIMLNGEESELRFINEGEVSIKDDRLPKPADAFLVIFSVVDKNSFETAEMILKNLREHEMLRSRPAILVGNKVDMARSREVSAQEGRYLACTCRAKYIEVSVGINHNVDELLVGILTQIRLKRADGGEGHDHWYRNRNFIKASLKARQMFTWVFGKEDTKLKNCENLHIL